MNGVNSAGRLMPGAPGVDWVRELQIYPMAERCTGATRLADLEMHARRRAVLVDAHPEATCNEFYPLPPPPGAQRCFSPRTPEGSRYTPVRGAVQRISSRLQAC